MNIEELRNPEILQMWYDYLTGPGRCTENTYLTFERNIRKLVAWCEFFHPTKNLLQLDRKNIKEYVNYIKESREYTVYSLRTIFTSMKSFYNWAVDEAEFIENSPHPRVIKMGNHKSNLPWSPTYEQIIQIRRQSAQVIPKGRLHGVVQPRYDIALARSTAMEIMLSTGIRVSELGQLRVDNINFAGTVYDEEEKRASQYAGGSIHIDAYHVQTKYYRAKTVMFSTLAGRLLKLHIKVFGLVGNMPLFPWNRKDTLRWFNLLGAGIVEQENWQEPRREKNFTDISPDILAKMSPEIRKRVEKKMLADSKNNQHVKNTHKYTPERRRKLKNHSFRHFNAAMMYHRGWTGTRHDLPYIKDRLGHNSNKQSLDYITTSTAVTNDRQWKMLCLGDSRTYWHLFAAFVQFTE